MLRYTPVLLLTIASAAHAALPVYNTDMPAKGELLATTGASYGKTNADEVLTFGVIPGQGAMEYSQESAAITLDYGFSNRFNGLIASSVASTKYEEEVLWSGVFTEKHEIHKQGLSDLGLGVEYLLREDVRTPMVVRLMVTAPTASDYPGVMGVTINGTQIAATEAGGMGRDYTSVTSQVGGSVKGNQNTLEWELAWQTDDEKTTEDSYDASVSWVHHFNQATYFRLNGGASFEPGMHTATTTVSDATNFFTSVFLAHQFSENMRVGVGYGYTQFDDLHYVFANGITLDQSNMSRQAASLSLSYLFF